MSKTTELVIWFCGFYEGEGSVSNDKSNNNRIRLSISQNDRTPLDLGKSIWGGNIRERIRESKNKTCHGHEWTLNHNQAIQFINDIKLHMKIPYKIKQIEDAFEKTEQGHKGEYSCSFCDKIFNIAANRRRHEVNIHINNEERYSCACGLQYTSRDSLTRHLKKCTYK
jgi:hypothetical protein